MLIFPKVSNISDEGWIGTEVTLKTLAPLLKSKRLNLYATTITLYLNAVHEVYARVDPIPFEILERPKVLSYLPLLNNYLTPRDPDFSRFEDGKIMVRDMDGLFDRYMAFFNFKLLAISVGLEMKSQHSIIPRWPCRLRSNASRDEFMQKLASAHMGSERYVEWKRAG